MINKQLGITLEPTKYISKIRNLEIKLDSAQVLNGNLNSKYIRSYDAKGNNTETNHFNGYGSLEGNIIFKYDEQGNEIECIDSWLTDDIKHLYSYEYDKKDKEGNWLIQKKKYIRQSNSERKTQLTIIERTIVYY